MDVKAMNFNEGYFDAVIDKATFDSVLVINALFSVEKIRLLMLAKWCLKCIESWSKTEYM